MMKEKIDVIIVGGSYSGLAAAMALGRALRNVLVIDGGKPANRFTPHSHNFITHDGKTPAEIAAAARIQVDRYPSVKRIEGFATNAGKTDSGFEVVLGSGGRYEARKLVFATGIVDLIPDIPGFSECWGKSLLHCPYCHGYEVRDMPTGIFGNGEYAFEFGTLISNWTHNLTIFTNGEPGLTASQRAKLEDRRIRIIEHEIAGLHHTNGYIEAIAFRNAGTFPLSVLYLRPEFRQHSEVPMHLGCMLTPDGYIAVDGSQKTSVPGIYACGDNTTRLRTVANAVAMGTTAGMMVNKELVMESF